MKKLLIIPILFLSLGMISCKKEPVPEQQLFMQHNNMPIINPGLFVFGTCDNWYVSLLQINKADLTDNYKLVRLIFCPDNTFVVSNDIIAITGYWDITSDEENPITLTLDLNYPADIPNADSPLALWAELNGVWKIERFQKNMISLQIDEQAKRLTLERGALY